MPNEVLDFVPARLGIIQEVARLAAESAFPIAVLSGSTGVGKSTIVRSLLPSELARANRTIMSFTGSPSLNVQQIGTDVAIALGFTDQRYTERYEKPKQIHQAVGQIDESQDIQLNQAAVSVTVENQRYFDGSDLAAWLNALVTSSARTITIIIDQVEQLYLPGARTSAIRLLEQLLRAALVCDGRVALVLAVRDRYIHEIIHLAANYPGLVSRIVPVHGLQPVEARSFIEAGLDWYGVKFSKTLRDRLVARLQGHDGRIWPVALHACCRPLAEIARTRGRTAGVKDLESLGELSGVLARAVNDELTALNSDGTGDALYILSSVASSYQTEGPISLSDLAKTLPSYPLTDLEPIVNALVGLKLLERDRSGSYRPSHDSIAGAVAMLRSPGGASAVVQRLDDAVARWSKSGSITDISSEHIAGLLRTVSQPTPHLIFLAAAILRHPQDDDTRALLRSRLAKISPGHLIRLVWAQARRQGRLRSLGPDGVFALALAGHDECLDSALDGIRSAALGPDTRWLPAEYQLAINRSSVQFDSEILRRCDLGNWPAAASRVVIRSCIRQERMNLQRDVLTGLWASLPSVLRTDLLQLAALHAPDDASTLIDEALQSDRDYLRAAAVEASSLVLAERSADVVIGALADDSTMVRRRATYLLGRLSQELAVPALADLATNDPSSFVREAAVECIGDLPLPQFEPVVLAALSDSSGIVRESAVYALRHVVGAERASEHVRSLVNDNSPHVREAVLRVLSIANRPPAPEVILADLRANSESLRAAALEVLILNDRDFAAPLVSEILAKSSSKTTTIGALRVIAASRLEATISDLARIVSEVDDAEVLCEAALTLQSVGGESASELLCSLVFHPSADVRERAVYALAEVGGVNAANVLMSCLYDPNTAIQVRAVYGLARLRIAAAKEVIRLLSTSSAELAEAVRYYQREIGDA